MALFQERGRARRVGQSPHVNSPVDDRAIARERMAASGPADGLDPEIDVWRQPSIQPDLLLARPTAGLDVANIEKAEVHRAF